ncbi:hypothetical protein [Actinomadura sp. KC345]|nr:hypothetical protein [Actinomadura sp. KC345]
MTHPEPAPEPESAPTTSPARLTIAWLIVGIPLAYGLIETVRASLPLFGG